MLRLTHTPMIRYPLCLFSVLSITSITSPSGEKRLCMLINPCHHMNGINLITTRYVWMLYVIHQQHRHGMAFILIIYIYGIILVARCKREIQAEKTRLMGNRNLPASTYRKSIPGLLSLWYCRHNVN